MTISCVSNVILVWCCVLCSHCTLGNLWMMGRVGNSVMSSLTSLADTFIDSIVHRTSHYALYITLCTVCMCIYIYIYIYTYCTIYVLSCVGGNGGSYVKKWSEVVVVVVGQNLWSTSSQAGLQLLTMVIWHIRRRYVWYIWCIYVTFFLLNVCHAPCHPPITTPLGLL